MRPPVAARSAQLSALVGAAGFVLAGIHPADVNENRHFLAALLVFVPGNVALLVAARAERSAVLGPMRRFTLVLGFTGVVATALFLAQVDLGLWTVAVGARLSPGLGCPVRPA